MKKREADSERLRVMQNDQMKVKMPYYFPFNISGGEAE